MTKLDPMTEDEYTQFMKLSAENHITDQIKASMWTEEEAPQKMRELTAKFLPQGLSTPNHHFFTISDLDKSAKVGALWYFITEQNGQPLIFVMDIQVYPEYKRQGYGTKAFQIMEQQAKELDIPMIALSVFPHNEPAKAMYQKLGYAFIEDGHTMVKPIV